MIINKVFKLHEIILSTLSLKLDIFLQKLQMSYIDHKKLKNLINLNKLSNTNRILNHDLIKYSRN